MLYIVYLLAGGCDNGPVTARIWFHSAAKRYSCRVFRVHNIWSRVAHWYDWQRFHYCRSCHLQLGIIDSFDGNRWPVCFICQCGTERDIWKGRWVYLHGIFAITTSCSPRCPCYRLFNRSTGITATSGAGVGNNLGLKSMIWRCVFYGACHFYIGVEGPTVLKPFLFVLCPVSSTELCFSGMFGSASDVGQRGRRRRCWRIFWCSFAWIGYF